MKKVAVLQSNYIPWKGYFDIIHDVDLFIFHDDLQYTKGDWRNRNKIISSNGLMWLTIPVGTSEKRLIDEVLIQDGKWQKKHWSNITAYYSRAPYFKMYKEFFEYVYLEKKWDYLHEVNRFMIIEISRNFLGTKTQFADSREFHSVGVKHEKLLSLVKATGAGVYLSGPAAKDYIVAEDYEEAGIELVWKNYSGYPEYKQLHGEVFEHGVSIVDLLFNTGSDAPYYIWGWRADLLKEENILFDKGRGL